MDKSSAMEILANVAACHPEFKPGRLSVHGEGFSGNHAVIDFAPIAIDLSTLAKWFPSNVVVYHMGGGAEYGDMYVMFRDRNSMDFLVEALGEKAVLSMLSDYFSGPTDVTG
jgi:hypothetical protein